MHGARLLPTRRELHAGRRGMQPRAVLYCRNRAVLPTQGASRAAPAPCPPQPLDPGDQLLSWEAPLRGWCEGRSTGRHSMPPHFPLPPPPPAFTITAAAASPSCPRPPRTHTHTPDHLLGVTGLLQQQRHQLLLCRRAAQVVRSAAQQVRQGEEGGVGGALAHAGGGWEEGPCLREESAAGGDSGCDKVGWPSPQRTGAHPGDQPA